MKYDIWKIGSAEREAVNALSAGGYSPLCAMLLAARGMKNAAQADEFCVGFDGLIPDPYLLTDMREAVARVRLAISRGEKIAVYGDYDVDGITATSLLMDFLRGQGAECVPYIPGRLGEGYGLNPPALHYLAEQGVKLVVSVDCGITAVDEAELCRALGMELVITDHHECKERLPDAAAVVDPCRPDGGYPHTNLSGVGVAFKLACAMSGCDIDEMLRRYADLVCLGTIADVIPLRGESRIYVRRGLEIINTSPRPGLAALLAECGKTGQKLTAASVGFILAPRINAAGRMGNTDTALELFLTDDPTRAAAAARALCEMNRKRQAIEAEIYQQAVESLGNAAHCDAVVLADERWHQGVVGIVASRLAEAYGCPTFLICLDGEHGKASSRSYGGFNLFSSLGEVADLLESYGGHELAAGFTITRDNIPRFGERMRALAHRYFQGEPPRQALHIDCAVSPELLTLHNIESLSVLEPCGSGWPKPTLLLENAVIERIMPVGSGKHTRLRLRGGHGRIDGIYFAMTPEQACIAEGDWVDVAFVPEINDYRGEQTVQLNIVDIRPHCAAECSTAMADYRLLRADALTAAAAAALLPDRTSLAAVWRYLAAFGVGMESEVCLCRKIVRWSNCAMSVEKLLACLDIFSEAGLLELHRDGKTLQIRLTAGTGKADLNETLTMQRLLRAKES